MILGNVTMGKNVWIGPDTIIDGSGGLSIGDNVNISGGAKILTHDTVKRCVAGYRGEVERKPTSIGANTFIGSNAVVLKGVNIGVCCVVQALSLVNHDVPHYTIVGGIPARRLGVVEVDYWTGEVVLLWD